MGKYLIWCRYIDHNINLVYFRHLDTSSAHEMMMMTRRKKDNHKQCKSFILMTVFLAFFTSLSGWSVVCVYFCSWYAVMGLRKRNWREKLNSFPFFIFYFHSISINPLRLIPLDVAIPSFSTVCVCSILLRYINDDDKQKGTRNIIDLCIKHNVPNLIHTSSALVTLWVLSAYLHPQSMNMCAMIKYFSQSINLSYQQQNERKISIFAYLCAPWIMAFPFCCVYFSSFSSPFL